VLFRRLLIPVVEEILNADIYFYLPKLQRAQLCEKHESARRQFPYVTSHSDLAVCVTELEIPDVLEPRWIDVCRDDLNLYLPKLPHLSRLIIRATNVLSSRFLAELPQLIPHLRTLDATTISLSGVELNTPAGLHNRWVMSLQELNLKSSQAKLVANIIEGLPSTPTRGTLRKFTFAILVEHELQPELKDIILTLRSFPKLAYIKLPLSVSDLGIRSNFPDPLLTAQPYHLNGFSLGQCSSLYSLNVHIVAN
jgi:hypothetical protein